ncbi:MAG: histone deacetylase [Myxococcaceae bacterium]
MAADAPTLVFSDPLFLEHDPGRGHPESPARLQRVLSILKELPVPGVEMVRPRPATDAEVARVHTPALRAQLAATAGKQVVLDADTQVSPKSYEAALLAAGAAVGAAEAVLNGQARNAFALVRPPGHHAEPNEMMGFCLLNNAAIAAEAARLAGAERVLVLDWDVHHGNGTQAAFWNRSDVLYQSVHQFPFYPGTGAPTEVGQDAGAGFTVNCGLPGGRTDADFGAVFHDLLLPIASGFAPHLVIVSAGFDPHEDDPLGGMLCTERGFAAMCSVVKQLAEATSGGRLVLLLEGGYSLGGLPRSVHACLEVLVGRKEEFPTGASREASHAIRLSLEALRPYWPML